MNTRSRLLASLFALALPGLATAQSAVPALMNYQAYISDAAGNPIGASPTPVNRLIHFKFWNHPTDSAAANLLYSESQTVTVNDGDFSVLLGQGAVITGEETKHTFANAFTNADLFLGITVDVGDDGIGNDSEITPRQQIVATAFAVRSQIAEAVTTGAITETMLGSGAVTAANLASGAVTLDKVALGAIKGGNDADGTPANRGTILDASITSFDLANNAVTNAKIADNAVGTAELADNAVTKAKIATGAIESDEIKDFTITSSDISSDIGLWARSGSAIRYQHNVGIATAATQNRLRINKEIYSNDPSGQQHELQLELVNSAFGTGGRSMGIGVLQDGLGVIQVKEQGVGAVNRPGGGGYQQLLLQPTGRVSVGYLGHTSYSLSVNGQVSGVGAYVNLSDARYKTNVETVATALDKITQLRGVGFDWKSADYPDLKFTEGRQLGFIAQEIREILPEVVAEDEKGFLSVAYSNVVPVAVEAIKELKDQLDAKQTKVTALEKRLAELEAKDQAREARLLAIEKRFAAEAQIASAEKTLR